MTVFIIPTPSGDQPFAEQRSTLDGRDYVLTFQWSAREERWFLSVADESNDPIASGLKIVANVPLGRRVRDARWPPGWIIALSENDEAPLLDELGGRVVLYYYDEAETLLGDTTGFEAPVYTPTDPGRDYLTIDGDYLTIDGERLYI